MVTRKMFSFLHSAEFFTIRIRLSDRFKVIQHKINFVKNCFWWDSYSQLLDHQSGALTTESARNMLGISEVNFVLCTTSHVGLCSFLESLGHYFIKV